MMYVANLLLVEKSPEIENNVKPVVPEDPHLDEQAMKLEVRSDYAHYCGLQDEDVVSPSSRRQLYGHLGLR
jgi:hypothetical protein